MKRSLLAAIACWAVASASAQQYSSEDLAGRTLHRRALEAVIWGMPAVNAELMFGAVAEAGADFNQVVLWSRPISWKNQTLTPNPDTIYVFPFFNTKDAGPMVLEVPPADGTNSITGSIDDAWQTALEDVGPAGADKGMGGKYLILPPGYGANVPEGYIPLRSATYAGFVILRSNLSNGTKADIARAVAYGKRIKFYPLSGAADEGGPPATKFIDAVDVLFDSTIPYDLRFFQTLDRFVQREPWLERNKAMIDVLKTIGIVKGKPFTPDETTKKVLEAAAAEAHAWLDLKYEQVFEPPFAEGTHWALPASPAVAEALQSNFADPNAYPVEDRGVTYSMAYFSAKHIGTGQYYLMTIVDGGEAAQRIEHLSPDRSSERAGPALLVGDGLRPQDARVDPRSDARESRIEHARPPTERGRIGRALFRTAGAGRQGIELGSHKVRRRF